MFMGTDLAATRSRQAQVLPRPTSPRTARTVGGSSAGVGLRSIVTPPQTRDIRPIALGRRGTPPRRQKTDPSRPPSWPAPPPPSQPALGTSAELWRPLLPSPPATR